LARTFAGTTEIGAVIEFLAAALESDIVETKPQALLDYADALLQAKSHESALRAVNIYEERFGASAASRVLRVKALIAGGYMTQAEQAIAALGPDAPNTLSLRLDLAGAKVTQLRSAIGKAASAGDSPLTSNSPDATTD